MRKDMSEQERRKQDIDYIPQLRMQSRALREQIEALQAQVKQLREDACVHGRELYELFAGVAGLRADLHYLRAIAQSGFNPEDLPDWMKGAEPEVEVEKEQWWLHPEGRVSQVQAVSGTCVKYEGSWWPAVEFLEDFTGPLSTCKCQEDPCWWEQIDEEGGCWHSAEGAFCFGCNSVLMYKGRTEPVVSLEKAIEVLEYVAAPGVRNPYYIVGGVKRLLRELATRDLDVEVDITELNLEAGNADD